MTAATTTDPVPIAELVPTASSTDAGAALDDAAILARYAVPDRTRPWLRVNFVTTLDGAASADGVTAGLGGPADLRVFDLLRRLADVVLVAAGTVRAEGYGPMRLGDDAVAWRRAHGLSDHPVFAIVSGSLDLDPSSAVFTEAPVRPIVLTVESAPDDRRAALAEVADVVDCGADAAEPDRIRGALVARGLTQIHSEGGPSLLGSLVRADAVDELCLTISPTLEGGGGPRIATGGAADALRTMRLEHVFRSGDLLLTRSVRDGSVRA